MHFSIKEQQSNRFNDYVINSPAANRKLLQTHQRCQSSNTIYLQQSGFNRKKLTVVSRDNLRSDFRGDYHMTQNRSSLSSSNRTKLQNLTYSPMRTIESSQNTSQNNIQYVESLKNSKVIKSKLKRPISPSPITPNKVLKLKKSLIGEINQQSGSTNRLNQHQQYSVQRSLSKVKFESNHVSPMKINIEGGHRRMFSARNDIKSVQQTLRSNKMENQSDLRNQLMSIFNMKVLQFESRMQYQQETIKVLENKLYENNRKLKQKQKIIADLLSQRQRAKTIKLNNQNQHGKTQEIYQITGQNQAYILKRMQDIEIKFQMVIKEESKIKYLQHFVDQKISSLQYEFITFNSGKLNVIKNQLTKFLSQKSTILSSLSESIFYLDNKLIGRTQAIKELISELKLKVKQVQDGWTNKQSKDTKESMTLGLREDSDIILTRKNNIRRVQNKLKQLTTADRNSSGMNSQNTVQGSLQFSLTSYDQQQLQSSKNIKNVYYDYNEMSDVSIGLQNFIIKDESSRLTDDFYYPGGMGSSSSIKNISRSISPIANKNKQQKSHNKNQYYGQQQTGFQIRLCQGQQKLTTDRFRKKVENNDGMVSPTIDRKEKTKINIKNNDKETSPTSTSQTTIKISHQTINKKIESIQQLIDAKLTVDSEQIERGQLRCYVDKSGYLKYTDSKTFVFDKRGNLIPCTQGEFWFLVTKGLIYGKRDDQQSHTISFIEIDE